MYQLLIVDDEAFMREYTIRFIPWAELGFEVAGQASNGKEALAFLEQHPVDVILTDVLMPVMDGIALAQAVAKHSPRPKVLFFSAYADFEYAKQAVNNGAAGYVLKSDEKETIIQVFANVRHTLDQERRVNHSDLTDATLIVRQAVNYIRQHYSEDISLSDVANHVAVHPVHLSRSLSAQMKKSYLDILTDCRIEAAKRLLRTTNEKVYAIATQVGYRKSAYFIELFKRATGCTPQQYRDKQMGGSR